MLIRISSTKVNDIIFPFQIHRLVDSGKLWANALIRNLLAKRKS